MQIRLADLFMADQIKSIDVFEEDFKELIAHLEKMAMIADFWPVSFMINDIRYIFKDRAELEAAIKAVCQEFTAAITAIGKSWDAPLLINGY